MADSSSVRLLTPAFVALTLSDLAYFSAAGVLLAVTPLFVVGPLESDKAGVGLAMGAFSVTTLLLRPLAGRWTDRYGRRRLLLAGAVLYAVLVTGHLLVDGVVALVVLRLLLGVAEALYFVAGFAALADLAPPGRAGEALSLNSLALYVGIAVGPLVGQGLLDLGGYTAAWLGAATLSAAAVGLAAKVPETLTPQAEDASPTPLVHRAALLPGIGLGVGIACMSGFFAFAVLHARDLGLEAWSVVLLAFGSVVVGCRTVFRSLPDRLPPLPLAAASLFLTGLGLLTIASVDSITGLFLGTGLLAVGTAFITPAVFAAVFGMVDPSERGSAAATVSVFIDLGFGGGPMLLGLVAAGSGIPVAFAVAAAVSVAGALLLLVGARSTPLAERTA
ncbi:MAG: MFS transporter [Nocardioidaceae bacterium]